MTDMITTGGSAVTVQQLAIPRGLLAATEPYRRADKLANAAYAPLMEIGDFVRVDADGELVCIQNAKTEESRWRLGRDARCGLSDLPAHSDVRAALQAIRHDIDTEPAIEHRVDMIGVMLDVQGIAADTSYIQYLAWKLGDCPKRETETRERSKPWFSLTTISRTVDQVLATLRPEEGRPIPVADILDIAGRNASQLIGLHHALVTISNTISWLHRIDSATKDASEPDDDEMDIPF